MYGRLATDLLIAGRRVDLVQHAGSVSLQRQLERRMSVSLSGSVVAGGELRVAGRTHELRPGGSFSLGLGREWLGDTAGHGFLTTSLALSGTFATTSATTFATTGGLAGRDLYIATDFSFAMAVGKTFWNVWSPYLGARVFGGPIWWTAMSKTIPGQDPDHHAISVGSVLTLPGNFELAVDWAPVGARTVTAQVAVSF